MYKVNKNRLVILYVTVQLGLATLVGSSALAANRIQIENAKPGSALWRLSQPAVQREIEGYASATSVNVGEKISFHVSTAAHYYTQEIFRMGWYGGVGARLMPTHLSRTLRGEKQPEPTPDPHTHLNAARWKPSFELKVPEDWVSGVYVVKLTEAGGKQSYMIFTVRDDNHPSDIAVELATSTWQAYNNWGGHSLYDYNSIDGKRANEVSYDRPYAVGPQPSSYMGAGAGEFFTTYVPHGESVTGAAGEEYNMVRFLERSGFNVSYFTNTDTHQGRLNRAQHKVVISPGHDEYWSKEMRDAFEAFRDRGGYIGMMGGNAAYWQVRLRADPVTGMADRVQACYKYNDGPGGDGKPVEPINTDRITIQWRDPIIGRPESELMGQQYIHDPTEGDLTVRLEASHWLMKDTGLKPGDVLKNAIGYESDMVDPNSADIASGRLVIVADGNFQDKRGNQSGYTTSTLLETPAGGFVLAAGNMRFTNLLDDFNSDLSATPADERIQKMMCNFLLKAL